jgi:hypothetical protein
MRVPSRLGAQTTQADQGTLNCQQPCWELHLGRSQRDEADYWASQIQPALNIDDAQTIAWLLLDIAGHPLVPDQLSQRARAWATALERLGATS